MADDIYAPWRAEYITGPKEKGCVFCRIAAEDNDAENYVLHRGEFCYVVLNRFPYTSGHSMIVPFRHFGDLEAMTPEETTEMMRLAQKMVAAQKKEFRTQGFNVGFNLGQPAGAGIEEHIHLHMVPRWVGDSSFVSTIGNSRVISISFDTIYEALKKYFS
jgi:ATP adenylyltransferase